MAKKLFGKFVLRFLHALTAKTGTTALTRAVGWISKGMHATLIPHPCPTEAAHPCDAEVPAVEVVVAPGFPEVYIKQSITQIYLAAQTYLQDAC